MRADWQRTPGLIEGRRMLMHNWLVCRPLRRYVAKALAAHGRGRLLDVGCCSMPYKKFGRNVDEWVGLDSVRCIHRDSAPEVVSEAEALPFDDESFDTVLCTQVLEHTREPARILREMCRVLVPGGHLILTADFIWHLHEDPEDNYRFPPTGLKRLVEQAGLSVTHLEVLLGFYGIVFQEIAYRAYGLVPGTSRWYLRWLAGALAQPAQILGYPIRALGRPDKFGNPVCVAACRPRVLPEGASR